MRKFLIIALILSLVLIGCATPDPNRNTTDAPGLHESTPDKDQSSQTDSTDCLEGENSGPVASDLTEAISTVPDSTENGTTGIEPAGSTESITQTQPPQQATETPTTPTNLPEETKPTPTTPPETTPTQPQETKLEETQSPVTELQIDKDSYEFKLQVAQYAAQYINQYRAAAGVSPCEVLPGMTLVAEYRADQLTRNYAHDTADKREALAYYQYGRWIDATIAGLDPEDSYYEADAAEAICAGFNGSDAEAMGKKIADLICNSPSHWSYVGSSKFSYIGIGVDYKAGTAYGWYGCVMVGRSNYG